MIEARRDVCDSHIIFKYAQKITHFTICLNSIQGIKSLHKDKYVNKKINKHFVEICKNKNISFGKAMMIAINRSKNFNIKNYVDADNAPYNEVLENGLIGIYYADK